MQLVDKSGTVHDVPDDQVGAAVSSGNFGFIKGSEVPVVDEGGNVGKVSSEHAAQVIGSGKYRIAKPEEATAAENHAKYGGALGGAAAFGEGAARTLTLGASDPLAIAAAGALGGKEAEEATRAHLAGVKEEHPYLEGAGQVAGALVPLVAGDVGGLLGAGETVGRVARGAETLGAIPRAIDAAGTFAADSMARLAGTSAEGMLGKVAQGAVKEAARGIIEGGIYNVGAEVSDAALQNRELTAESVLAAAGHGALWGGALGGLIGGATPVAKAAAKSALDFAGSKVGTLADEQYIRALSANNKKALREMSERFGPEAESVIANRIRSEGIVKAGDNIEKIAERAVGAEESAIQELRGVVAQVGADGVRLGDVTKMLRAGASEFDSKLNHEVAGNAMRAQAEHLERIYADRAAQAGQKLEDFTVPLDEMLQKRRELAATVYDRTTSSVASAGLKKAERTIEESIMSAGENAAKESGNSLWKADYLAAKKRFAEIRWIKDTVEDAVTAKLRNRFASPSDYAAGSMGALLGAATGGAVGESEGGGHHTLKGIVTGALMGAAHHVIRTRGNATAAVLLDQLGTARMLSKFHVEAMGKLDAAVAAALSDSKPRKIPSVGKMSDKRFDEELTQIHRLASAPEAVGRHLESQVGSLALHAPEVANDVTKKSKAAIDFLASKAPTQELNTASLTPQLKAPISSVEKAKWLRYKDAVEGGPLEILRKLGAGNMTLEDAETLKTVWPGYFAEAQRRVMEAASQRTKPLPYQKAVRLGILFDAPTHSSLDPHAIKTQQDLYAAEMKQQAQSAQGPTGQGKKPGAAKTSSLKLSSSVTGPFESAMNTKE